jgi:SNF2 family DNA or RNA helicase
MYPVAAAMRILHGTWIPDEPSDFTRSGAFYLWVEVPSVDVPSKVSKGAKRQAQSLIHPGHLTRHQLEPFLAETLGIDAVKSQFQSKYFTLPTSSQAPLPSAELSRYLEIEIPEEYTFESWQIDCYEVTTPAHSKSQRSSQPTNVIKFLNDLHFLALHQNDDFQFGADLLFWYHYTQAFKAVISREQYIPALKYRTTSKSKGKTQQPGFEIYATWEIVSQQYESNLQRYSEYIPLVCLAGRATLSKTAEFYAPELLLRHFSEIVLESIVTHTPTTAKFDQQVSGTILDRCLHANPAHPHTQAADLELYQQWLTWKTKITRTQTDSPFTLCLKLHAPPQKRPDAWQLELLVASKQDPSFKVALSEYWAMGVKAKAKIKQQFGKDFEASLLLNLGYAARMYPHLWQGLETAQPVGMQLTLEEAFEFLKESAWVLEDAGYTVIVPAWYTPAGRRRAKLRLKASSSAKPGKSTSKGLLSLDSIVQYQYELAIGDQTVTPKEWQQLVNAKTSLVQFRGEWIELNQDKMQQMLEFWQKQNNSNDEMTLMELLQKASETNEELEIESDKTLKNVLEKLRDKSRLELIHDIPQLQGSLREYQKRGVAWLQYLEQLGLNGCLADDMGMGKSFQVIARLVQERQASKNVLPTLLIAPTSVVGNWQREILKFAPHLSAIVHHGNDRIQHDQTFKTVYQNQDLVITSYTLARKDEKLLNSVQWQRVVLDEAQNIKNPKAAQTRAILKLQAHHRLALTGTPVENRLLDLWSIFNFLNPGYLGKEAQFRKTFETPIQKNNDRTQSATLKKLVEPLILRRVKTDPTIISDLPDKVEQKLYTNLTKEQASLYEAVVKDVSTQLDDAEGIQRKGLMLSTLLRLKQICNHPAQFLQDDSEFSLTRSHKLSRLSEMTQEAIDEGSSILIFSQFKEVCDNLDRHIRQVLHANTYYIHGGTARLKREQMISEFQHPETEPSVFILSLKAGGVGITLTKANYVFHFDRWWNPAVEDQATDRAFRIGQHKNVFVHKFVTIGTLEERIDQMIEDKKKLASSVVGTDESWLTELDNDAFKQLIALNRSAILE